VGQGTPNVSGLCAGPVLLTITDALLCDTALLITISEPPPLEVTGTSTNETCNGPCDGTATVVALGGVGPYAYTWNPAPPTGQGTPSVSGLCAGLWGVTVTDANGCDTTLVFDILPVQPIDAGLVTTDASCANTCDGSVSVTPSNGVAPYTFVWSPEPGTGQGTANATGLCPGNWQVTITDDAGCDTTVLFVIDAPPALQVLLTTQPADCFDPCSGEAGLNISGGVAPYVILWTPGPGAGQGTPVATGLCAGTNYSVTVTDGNGCDTTITFTIDPFDPIVPNSSSTPANCANSCDGTATVGPTGGQAPYTYVWSPAPGGGQGTPQATGLCPGVAEVTITDVDGCSIVASVLILSPDPIDANAVVQDPLCAGRCDGSITTTVSGGVASYTYTWSPVPPNGQGFPVATGLCAGTWTLTISDAAGCDTTLVFVLTEPPPVTLSASSTPSTCQVCTGTGDVVVAGGTPPIGVVWLDALGNTVGSGTSITGLCAGLYTAVATDANGCTAQIGVPVSDADGELLTVDDDETSCPGVCDGGLTAVYTCNEPPCTVTWSNAQGNTVGTGDSISDLCAGTWFAQVENGSGCITIVSAQVLDPTVLQTAISSSPVSCAGLCDGTATVGVTAGTPPYAFNWSPAPGGGQGTPFATGLCAGVYTIDIADGNGCVTTVSVLILEPDPLAVDAVVGDITCADQCDGSITLTTTGGTAPYTWFWNPVPLGQQGSPQLTDICADTWSVSVTDANGCTTSGQWTIAEPDPLLINTTFTPSTCLQCDGAASVSITGGTAPHTAEWFLAGALILVGTDADQLCAGNYTVVVSDANGCVVQSVVTLPDADGETPTPIDGAVGCANDCDGSVAVDLVCTAPPCVLQWTDADGNIIAGDVTSVTDLCTGTYTVQVTNASGCVSFTDVSVLPAQSIVPNLSSTPETCAGLCDGTATVGPAGGVQPYTFTWSPEPGGGQGTPQATGLCAGVYSVLIADAAGCDTTITVLILGPQPIDALGTVADVTCNGDCDGSITVNVAGGVAPYGSLWSPVPGAGQGTLVASSLCAGDWTLSVTDANGCTTAFTWTVTEPDPLAVDLSTVQSQCNDCVGEADAVITGGTAPYITVWGQGAAVIGFGEAITGLCAGIYTLAVTDASGCTLQTTVPIDDVDGEPTSTSDGSLTCPDDCDGTVSVDTPCVDAPCTFAWLDINGNDLGQNSAAATGLCAGSYLVVVTNASGCITIDTANVIAPDPIVANLSTTPASCFGACDGTATVGPTGGAGGYDFFWEPEPINGQGTPQATDLCAGAYTVTITDADGCAIVQGVLILEPPLLEATPIATHPLCADACDGTITVQPSGGTAPYTFVWSPEPPQGQGTAIASELCAGSWSVIISDANGCDTTLSIVLVDPDPLTAVVSTVDNLCAGDCFGEASVTIGGGTAGYTIVWQDDSGATIAQDVATIAALCTGAYTVNVIDANGCAINPSFSILENASIGADVLSTNETCFGPCDGTASITPFGGVGPYSFNWDPEPATGQGTAQVTGLCAGPSTVTITDDLGCSTAVTVTILPFQDIAPNAVVENITCSGSCDGSITLGTTGGNAPYAYAWQPVPPGGNGDPVITGLCAGEWTVTITDATGCTLQASWTVTEPLPLEVTIDAVVDATCQGSLDGSISITTAGGTEPYAWQWTGPAGFTATTEDITGLLAGSYTIAVTDANGCVVALNIDVEAQTTVVADAGADQQDCFGSAFTLDGTESTGAVGYTWTNAQGEVVATTAFADPGPLPPGTHTFTLTVTNGPCASTDQVTITVLALPPADAGPDQTIFISGSVTLGGNPSGPQGAVFSWTPDSTLSAPNVPNPVADPNVTTWYVLTVTDANGCARVDSVLITVLPDLVIFNGFTPNGDGWNDVWIIDNIEEFPECEVEIYNRWGELLFQSLGYRQPWDGRYSGGFVPVGTYYYVVKLNDPRFPDPFTGPLTVIR
jgi:gliding motility-associated-like protein